MNEPVQPSPSRARESWYSWLPCPLCKRPRVLIYPDEHLMRCEKCGSENETLLAFAEVTTYRYIAWITLAMALGILAGIVAAVEPGENAVPVHPDISNDEWIEWARPIWYGIRESDTLNKADAREHADERHIAPLQLGTIERCIRLWSNTGETVLSPFGGIGSEGYEAVRLGRKYIGIELKPSYWRQAVKNLQTAEATKVMPTLFDTVQP